MISTEEAAEILGVSPSHVRWYFREGLLPGRRIGARVLIFDRADVLKLNDNKPKKTGRPPIKKPRGRPKKDS